MGRWPYADILLTTTYNGLAVAAVLQRDLYALPSPPLPLCRSAYRHGGSRIARNQRAHIAP